MEVNNSSLFADPAELESKPELTAIMPANASAINNKSISEPTVEVRFCTGGRLSAPPILHFRDYSMLASQELAELPAAKDHLPIMVRILNSMVVEEFDCGLFHMEEAKEVLLNVYGKWWGDKLTGFKYLIDPELSDDKDVLMAKENISEADIPLSALEIVPLDPEIKEPINITAHGITVKFIYPRIRNSGIVDDLLKVKFAVQEQQFHKLKQILEYNSKQTDPEAKKEVNLQEAENYQTYLAEKGKWRLIYLRAQEICGIDDVVLDTMESRIEALTKNTKISVRHWQLYTEFLEGKGKFGLKDEAEFYSDILSQKVRRPFLFYTWGLIPSGTMERPGNVDDSVSFG